MGIVDRIYLNRIINWNWRNKHSLGLMFLEYIGIGGTRRIPLDEIFFARVKVSLSISSLLGTISGSMKMRARIQEIGK